MTTTRKPLTWAEMRGLTTFTRRHLGHGVGDVRVRISRKGLVSVSNDAGRHWQEVGHISRFFDQWRPLHWG